MVEDRVSMPYVRDYIFIPKKEETLVKPSQHAV